MNWIEYDSGLRQKESRNFILNIFYKLFRIKYKAQEELFVVRVDSGEWHSNDGINYTFKSNKGKK